MEEGIAFFHDGSKILECVEREMETLDSRISSFDPTTLLIRNGLLWPILEQNSSLRMKANELWPRARDLLKRSHKTMTGTQR